MMNTPTTAITNNLKGKRRIEFPDSVKRILREAAGYLCSNNSCLRPTRGVTRKKKHEVVAAGIGVAAHVHSASEQGPRGRGGLSEAQIKSAENGLWMCASCGELVDDFQDSYSAEHLLRMKAVRELAHEIFLHDSTIAMFANQVGIRPWNDVVWDHVAEMPVPEIKLIDRKLLKDAFMSLAIQRLYAVEQSKLPAFPALPEKYTKNAIARVLASLGMPPEGEAETVFPMAIPGDDSSYPKEPQVSLRSIALNMAKSWWRSIKGELAPNRALTAYSHVALAARNPHNAEIFNPGLHLKVTVLSLVTYTVEGGEHIVIEFKYGYNAVSELGWDARLEIKHGIHRLDSSLTKATRHHEGFVDPDERVEHELYKELIQKLVAGWEPIVYYSLLTGGSEQDPFQHFDPNPLPVKCSLGVKKLEGMLLRCKKVDAAIELENRWNVLLKLPSGNNNFVCNGDYFSDQVTTELMERAFEELSCAVRKNPFNPNMWKSGPLFMCNSRYGVFLKYNRGTLRLDRLPIFLSSL